MERHYETVCIVKPDIGEDAIKGIVGKAAKTVEDGKGTDVEVREWGRRKLAYPIQKLTEGYYFLMLYTAPPPASKELERTLRLNEDVIRYQTVRLSERPPALEAPAPSIDEGASDKADSGASADAEPADAKVAKPTEEGASDKADAGASADAEPAEEEGKKGGGDGE